MTEFQLICADVLEGLRSLPNESVQVCVTSPPYWGLRDYGVPGQLGLERTPDEYVSRMVEVFAEVRRVLRSDGTLWLNIGDSYAAQRGGTQVPAETLAGGFRGHEKEGQGNRGRGSLARPHAVDGTTGAADKTRVANRDAAAIGLKHKDLCGVPWLLAFALRNDGWYLRSDIIWSKPNPMPESVTDRPTKAHEYMFLLTKSARYYYDAAAIREQRTSDEDAATFRGGCYVEGKTDNATMGKRQVVGNRRTDKQRGHSRRHAGFNDRWDGMSKEEQSALGRNKRSVWTVATQPFPEAHFATFPTALVEPCILAGSKVDDTVLDPFNGSGTTGIVALGHQRNYIGIELNPAYVEMARRRLHKVAPLFTTERAVSQ